MNPHTATITECCDFLAECKGWKRPGYEWPNPSARSNGCWTRRDESVIGEIVYGSTGLHPIPQSLDAIAGALPEGVGTMWVAGPVPFWICTIGIGPQMTRKWFSAEADTELLARARAACLAWMEYKKESPCSPR